MNKFSFLSRPLPKYLRYGVYLAAYFVVSSLCKTQTHGFNLQKIYFTPAVAPFTHTLSSTDIYSIKPLLDQPFYFLGSGGECYCFESQDKSIVLKLYKVSLWRYIFFRNAVLEPPSTPDFTKNKNENGFKHYFAKVKFLYKERMEQTAKSCALSFSQMQNETGLLYLHLSPTTGWNKSVTLYDAIGIKQEIALDTLRFAVQKKATLFTKGVKQWLVQGNTQAAKDSIDSLLALVEKRCRLGLSDRDARLHFNFGLIGTEAIEIDLGSYAKETTLSPLELLKQDITHIGSSLKVWLAKEAPDLVDYVEEKMQAKIML